MNTFSPEFGYSDFNADELLNLNTGDLTAILERGPRKPTFCGSTEAIRRVMDRIRWLGIIPGCHVTAEDKRPPMKMEAMIFLALSDEEVRNLVTRWKLEIVTSNTTFDQVTERRDQLFPPRPVICVSK